MQNEHILFDKFKENCKYKGVIDIYDNCLKLNKACIFNVITGHFVRGHLYIISKISTRFLRGWQGRSSVCPAEAELDTTMINLMIT